MLIQVQNDRGVEFAEFTLDRPLTIIVGPNGCGKSTVLNQVRNQTPGQHIYIGPHRATRRQNARLRFMAGNLPTMSDIMGQPGLPGYEGVTLSTHARDPWEFDEAGNFFKYNLSKIEFQRSSSIAQIFDERRSVDENSVPDVWQPLRELTKRLLPHLEFSRVETSNYDNMRCLFHVHRRNIEIDFDDLSSGEKAVLQQLYPIIEPEILKRLQLIASGISAPLDKTLVIIDEPELHLHPSLQEKLVAYLRIQAVERSLKVLLATHSPTIIDAADQDDIYLLRPTEDVPPGENQMVALGREPNRLIAAQEAIGAVFPVTAARPLLFVEGLTGSQ